MPTYPVINLETKEKKTLSMTMKEYCEWKEQNPGWDKDCLLYTSPSPRDRTRSRMPSSA